MNAIWFLSKERNLLITGFNRVEKEVDGKQTSELWVTEMNGNSRKLATGKQAIELENTLLDIIWEGFPAIITDGSKSYGTNVMLKRHMKKEDEQGAE